MSRFGFSASLFSLVSVILLVYWPALEFGYVWDDLPILVENAQYHQGWPTLLRVIWGPFLGGELYFRPLALLTLGAEQLIGRGSAFLPHLDALLLHAGNSCLVTLIVRVLGQRRGFQPVAATLAGFLAGVFYALHPAVMESAVWISVRFDALMTFFCLLALYADRVITVIRTRIFVVSTCFLLAALCKEMAVGWVLALPFWQLMTLPKSVSMRELPRAYLSEGHAKVYAGVFVAGLIYLWIRWLSHGHVYQVPGTETFMAIERAALSLKSLGTYISLGLWPFTTISPLHFLDRPVEFLQRDVFIGLIGVAALLVLIRICLSPYRKDQAVLLVCFYVSLLPVLHLMPLQIGDNYANDRFLTLPLTFLAMAVGLQLVTLWMALRSTIIRAALVLALAVWFALSTMSVRVNLPFWKDDLSFSLWSYQRAPDSLPASISLQTAYLNAGLYQQARQFSENLQQYQGGALYPYQQVNYAYALGRSGQIEEGLKYMEGALAGIAPDARNANSLYMAYSRMGILQLLSGRPNAAIEYLNRALGLRPQSLECEYFIALAIAATNDSAGRKYAQGVFARMPPPRRAVLEPRFDSRVLEIRDAMLKLEANPTTN